MQPIPSDVSSADVWQWVNNGFFFHMGRGHKLCPASMMNDAGDLIVERTDGRRMSYRHDECFVHWPECGAINMSGYAVNVLREQSRQYRRTYNMRCVHVNIPRKWDVMKRHAEVRKLEACSRELVEALFSPVYYTYTKAMELLDTGWVSVALNPHIIVAGELDYHAVYYRDRLVATIRDGRVSILDKNLPATRILKWFDGRVRHATS